MSLLHSLPLLFCDYFVYKERRIKRTTSFSKSAFRTSSLGSGFFEVITVGRESSQGGNNKTLA